jgi:hypothetical protein
MYEAEKKIILQRARTGGKQGRDGRELTISSGSVGESVEVGEGVEIGEGAPRRAARSSARALRSATKRGGGRHGRR